MFSEGGSQFFAAVLDRAAVFVRFISDHRSRFWVEPIFRVLTEHADRPVYLL